MMPVLLAIDQGTTSTRAIAFDSWLKPLATARRRDLVGDLCPAVLGCQEFGERRPTARAGSLEHGLAQRQERDPLPVCDAASGDYVCIPAERFDELLRQPRLPDPCLTHDREPKCGARTDGASECGSQSRELGLPAEHRSVEQARHAGASVTTSRTRHAVALPPSTVMSSAGFNTTAPRISRCVAAHGHVAVGTGLLQSPGRGHGPAGGDVAK